ncbi:MAG: TlpA family protein disulfide reductase [Bauldia sp.]|nr:TlpA family protein disulfide reductase [Bauldia sp.]
MAENAPRSINWRLVGIRTAIVAGLAVVAVYATVPRGSNADPACEATAELAPSLREFARGEVAAFQPATSPTSLRDLGFLTPDGQPTTLGAFRGRTVLLNLWATWCVPCREEMPALDQLQAELGGDDFMVLALNVDRPGIDTNRFLREVEVTLANYADPDLTAFRQLQAKGFVTGLPTTVMIGPDGCDLGVMRAPAEWASADAVALVNAAKSGAAATPGV